MAVRGIETKLSWPSAAEVLTLGDVVEALRHATKEQVAMGLS